MTTVTDLFNRSSAGSLGSPWTAETSGAWDTDGTHAASQATTGNAWLLLSSADQVFDSVETSNAGNYHGVYMRAATTSSADCYESLYWGPSGFFRWRKIVGGGATNIEDYAYSGYTDVSVRRMVYGSSATRLTLWIAGSIFNTPYVDSSSPITTGNYCGIHHQAASAVKFNSVTARDMDDAWTLLAYVGKSGAGTSSGSLFDSFYSNIIVASAVTAGGTGGTISDNKSNSWTSAVDKNDGATNRVTIYHVLSPTVGASHTFTWSGGAIEAIDVQAWRCPGGAPTLDQTNGTTSGTQPGSITPTANNCLLIAGAAGGTDASAPTIDSGFTVTTSRAFTTSVCLNSGMAYLVQDTAAAINPTWSDTGANAIASFKPPGGGGGGTTRGMPFGARGTAFNGGRTFQGVLR